MTTRRNFFISYNNADEGWAEWIASTLHEAGYTHFFQKWDFRPGGNFGIEMQKAAEDSERTLFVLTKNYLSSLFTQPEWTAAFNRDPTGEKRLLVPVRVERCEPAGMLALMIHIDLVDLSADEARKRLLAGLKPSGKPESPPAFPGTSKTQTRGDRASTRSTLAAFPGPAATVQPPTDSVRAAAEKLRSLFATSFTTFIAQARLRDDLAERILRRMRPKQHYEFEALFDRYFDQMTPDELRLHRTIRAYTESIQHEYNAKMLATVEGEPGLAVLPSLPALEQHLRLWLAKFERVFLKTPSMCLLYVGVEEGVGFPSQIEKELERYLRNTREHD